jgi:hypothetical protein
MQIKFIAPLSGPEYSYSPGDVVEWEDSEESRRFIEAGLAIPFAAGPIKETRGKAAKQPDAVSEPVPEADHSPVTATADVVQGDKK